MSYTSGVAMDQRGLRDVERWRDKIEVRLDNRQVFFLFFGSALVACLLFVLGVVVGKRLESRGRALAPEVEDPLALLDKVATTPRSTQTPAVTFPQTLFGGKGTQNGAKRTELKLAEPKLAEPSKSEPGKVADPGKANKNGESGLTALSPSEKSSTKPAKDKSIALVDSKPTTKSAEAKATPDSGKPAAAAPPTRASSAPGPGDSAAAAVPVAPDMAAVPAKSAPVPVIGAAATDSAKGKARFTLQLSSFQDRAEAEAFAAKFGSEKTYLVVSNLPGKGTWFRVRVGDFATSKDAFAGKATFEKKYGVIAYVAQR
ncbi:MAG: SPOR domain-containing protein [Polyangia bacterium]